MQRMLHQIIRDLQNQSYDWEVLALEKPSENVLNEYQTKTQNSLVSTLKLHDQNGWFFKFSQFHRFM